MKRSINWINVASGIGAGDTRCQDGPEAIMLKLNAKAFNNIIGNVSLYPTNIISNKLERIVKLNSDLCNTITESINQSCFPLVIGGDHSCAIGTWSGISTAYKHQGQIGLIWIDAHLDAHTFSTSPSQNIHGMPLAALLGHGDSNLTHIGSTHQKLLPENVCIIGARSYEDGELALLEKLNVKIFFMPEVSERGFNAVFNKALEHVQKNTIGYGISLDLDGIDPIEAPGVGTPVVNGIISQDLISTLNNIIYDDKLLCFELVEFNPYKDINDATLELSTKIITPFLLGEYAFNSEQRSHNLNISYEMNY